jgi:hypothetical protein
MAIGHDDCIYSLVQLIIFSIFNDYFPHSSLMTIYKHIEEKIPNPLNRPLHEYVRFVATISVTIFFDRANILSPQGELLHTVMPLMVLYFSVA